MKRYNFPILLLLLFSGRFLVAQETVLGPASKLDGAMFVASSTTTGLVWTNIWNVGTRKIRQAAGIAGYAIRPKYPQIADIPVLNPATGEYRAFFGRPGVAWFYYTLDKNGKTPRYSALGEMATVYDPTELPLLQNPAAILFPASHFAGGNDKTLAIAAYALRPLRGAFRLVFRLLTPGGNEVGFGVPTPVLDLASGSETKTPLYEAALDDTTPKGDYSIEVKLTDASEQIIFALARFDFTFLEYGRGGGIGPRLNAGVLWITYSDMKPSAIVATGKFPSAKPGRVLVLLGNRVISRSSGPNTIEELKHDRIIAGVSPDDKFPAERTRLVLYFEDTGYVLAGEYENLVDPATLEPLELAGP